MGEIKDTFDRDGYVVVRSALPMNDIHDWQSAWFTYAQTPRKVEFNPVAVNGPFPEPLASIYKHPALLDLVEQVFGPDIALYNHRFVVKDKDSRGPVFLHHDTPYHIGWPTKLSCFVPLTIVDNNGAMLFWPGTHRYGYLGDAGEIRRDVIEMKWHSPVLHPGDVVLMHSACWHESWAHKSGPDRVMVDTIMQPANDPSGIELLRGQWRCEPQPWLRGNNIFIRSRSSRLRELQAIVDAKA